MQLIWVRIIVFYFHPSTEAPISLLEFGLAARTKKSIVVCPEGYKKRGNVQIVCERYGLKLVESLEAVRQAIIDSSDRLREVLDSERGT